jgi:ABC-2 type transport system permease protein
MSFDLSNDIRLGRISSYLVYPFDFWKYHSASFIAFQSLQTMICSITITLAIAFNLITIVSTQAICTGFVYVMAVSLFWFALQFLTGIMAFWLEETWILRVIAQILTRFLSGALIPLDFFPLWARDALSWTPFPLLTFYPIKIFTGQMTPNISMVGMLLFWIVILILCNRWLWRRGMRLYTAAGM